MERGKWRLIDYTTEDVSGTLVFSSGDGPAEPIVLPIGQEGWHAIHIGFPHGIGWGFPTLKLTDDPCFTPIVKDPPPCWGPQMWEGFWKVADLTGQDLTIRAMPGSRDSVRSPHAQPCLAYVRLVALTDDQIAARQADVADPSHKKLIFMCDGYGVAEQVGSGRGVEAVLQMMEPARDTDFGTLLFQLNSPFGSAPYKSRHLEMMGDGDDLLPEAAHPRLVVNGYRTMADSGTDMLDFVLKHAKAMGLKAWVGCRWMNTVNAPYDEHWITRFAADHPEYWCRDREGHRVSAISMAYEEVRQFAALTFSEVLRRGADGLAILFVRSGPWLVYEEPVMRAFQESTGLDALELDEGDPRWVDFKCDLVTQYMWEIRAILDEEAARRGVDRLPFAVEVHANEENNRYWALDIARWAAEGIVDVVIAKDQVHVAGAPDYEFPVDFEYFKQAVRGTACKLYKDVMPRSMPPDEYRAKAREAYDHGCDGLSFWDTDDRFALNQWEVIRRLGHPDELTKTSTVKYRKIISMNGIHVDRYNVWWVY